MLSIINSITPNMVSNQMINNIITVVFLLIIFSLRYIIGGIAAKKHHTRILVQNLNLVSIPLLIVIFSIMIYKIAL
jgi:hypothetical protein